MEAYYDKDKETKAFTSTTVKDMLEEIGILSNTVIVVVNNTVVTETYAFSSDDEVKILSVVSGG